jgi:DNA-binding response OmpR family regulator
MQHFRGLNVLLIGNRGGLADSLALPLRADGHVVGDAPDGPAALVAARAVYPDVVVLDADIAGLDVPEVAQEIGGLSSSRRPFIIALAGRVVPECPPTNPGSGIDLYLRHAPTTSQVRDLLRRFQAVVSDFDGFDPMI